MSTSFDRQRLAPLKDTVAVVGIGETDYAADYRGAGGRAVDKGEARYDSYTLASRALKRALDDAGLKTGSGGLQFSLRDQSSSGQNSGNEAGRNAQRLIISEDDSIPAAMAGRTYGRMSGSGSGVDIRV